MILVAGGGPCRACFTTVNGALACGIVIVEIFRATKRCRRLPRIRRESVPEEKFPPGIGILQPVVVQEKSLWQIVALQLGFIKKRDVWMLIQTGVEQRCPRTKHTGDKKIAWGFQKIEGNGQFAKAQGSKSTHAAAFGESARPATRGNHRWWRGRHA